MFLSVSLFFFFFVCTRLKMLVRYIRYLEKFPRHVETRFFIIIDLEIDSNFERSLLGGIDADRSTRWKALDEIYQFHILLATLIFKIS